MSIVRLWIVECNDCGTTDTEGYECAEAAKLRSTEICSPDGNWLSVEVEGQDPNHFCPSCAPAYRDLVE